MANDLLSALKVYLTKVTDGERTPAEVAAALNTWVRESGESIKNKIEEEVESSVSKMGFVKKEEFDRLKVQVDMLSTAAVKKAPAKKAAVKKAPTKKAPTKKTVKKAPAKKAPTKKVPTKKAVKKK